MGRRLALIIGINSYQDSTFRPLQFAETDAKALAQWLVNTKGGNWSPADVQLVQGTHATRELIESLIVQMCGTMAGPGDLIFIYFAGHAFLDQRSSEGYLALTNTQYQLSSTGLHLLSLARQAMSNSRAGHIVFMLDCFQTGQVWNIQRTSPYDSKPLLGPTILNAVQQMGNRLFFCSCRGNEMAPEVGEKNLGVLMYRMIVGLCGPASEPATGQITLQRLHAYLFDKLGEQQRPQLFGQEQTPLILIGEMPSPLFPPAANPANQPSTGLPSLQQMPTTTGSVMAGAVLSGMATAQTAQRLPTNTDPVALSATDQQTAMLLRQARHLIQMQNPGEAFNLVEQALRIAPTNIQALTLKAQLLGTAGRFPDALAIIGQILQLDPDNALVWSMKAAILSNIGQYAEALQAVERSLELDPNNPETYTVKTSITDHMAIVQSRARTQMQNGDAAIQQKRGGAASFFRGVGIAILGLLMAIIGSVLPVVQPHLPVFVSFVLQSLGLALLCVNAFRGSYLYGFFRFFLTLFISIIPAALLGAGYVFVARPSFVNAHPSITPAPLLFAALSLAIAAVVPVILALIGLIGGLVRGVRRT